MKTQAAAFLARHNMYYEQMPFDDLVERFESEMKRGLTGEESSLYMLPTYTRVHGEPARHEPVLVMDAGGSNLRAARMHFDGNGRPVVEEMRKCRMPGAGDEIPAEEMFERMAALALEVCGEAKRACISFSYVFDALPDGDGRIHRLCKEVHVRGIEGSRVTAPLEAAMQRLGAPGQRRWTLINDSVGTLLGGMAQADRSRYDDYIGFIVGTGTNSCCILPAESITKDPAAMAFGGDMIVNLESGCFDKLLQGTADREIDANSELPGDHVAEKMIGGEYFPHLLKKTLLLAAEEGLLSSRAAENLAKLTVKSLHIDQLCLDPMGDHPIGNAMTAEAERQFAFAAAELLLNRAARIVAGSLCAILRRRALPRGSRVCICADGTTFRKNPLLRPTVEDYLAHSAGARLGIETEFLFTEDATAKGCAWAGLTGNL